MRPLLYFSILFLVGCSIENQIQNVSSGTLEVLHHAFKVQTLLDKNISIINVYIYPEGQPNTFIHLDTSDSWYANGGKLVWDQDHYTTVVSLKSYVKEKGVTIALKSKDSLIGAQQLDIPLFDSVTIKKPFPFKGIVDLQYAPLLQANEGLKIIYHGSKKVVDNSAERTLYYQDPEVPGLLHFNEAYFYDKEWIKDTDTTELEMIKNKNEDGSTHLNTTFEFTTTVHVPCTEGKVFQRIP